MLRFPRFRLPRGQKRLYLRALDLWESHPRLGFADAIIASAVEQQSIPLATFDSDSDAISSITRWTPVEAEPGEQEDA